MGKTVIFDLDGTLADTIYDIRDALCGMRRRLGFSDISVEQTLKNINNGAYALVKRSLPESIAENREFIEDAKKIYEECYEKCYNNKTKAFDGCAEMLKILVGNGCSISVLSNKQQPFVEEIVKTLFPEIAFGFVIGQGRFPTKPDPEAVRYIINETGARKSECYLVGDSDVDMKTALNAGVHPIGVSWGYRKPEILAENGAEFIAEKPQDINKLILLT